MRTVTVIGQREADDIKNKRFIGHDIDEIWDYKVVGIWQEEEREEAAKYGQQPGDVHLLDKDMNYKYCLLYTSPSPRDRQKSRMPSSA